MIETVGIAVVVVLALIGGLHLLWAASPWPLATRERFALLIGGIPAVPKGFAAMSIGVGVALLAAAWLAGARAQVLPSPFAGWIVEVGAWAVAAILLGRGAWGFVESSFDLADHYAGYRRLDLRYYSPLCILLGGAVAVIAWSP